VPINLHPAKKKRKFIAFFVIWKGDGALGRAHHHYTTITGPAMTIAYSTDDFNEVTVMLRWRGTILPDVLCRPAIWVLMFAHIAFFFLHVHHTEVTMPPLPWKVVSVPTSLLTFFIVFYSGNCFSRYYALYSHCSGMSSAVMVFAGLLRVHFPTASTDEVFNMCRYAVASVYMLYFQLGGEASAGGAPRTRTNVAVLSLVYPLKALTP
jgi:prepilin signal peptidase PulO-like enzyme (type II secretory pathway)